MRARGGDLPFAGRDVDSGRGHRLLASLGKRVLRPGGVGLTRTLLGATGVTDADVVELAPGLGRTAAEIVALKPRSYHGVDQDRESVQATGPIVAAVGTVSTADAARTGLPDASADVVIGEAMLTMQGEKLKAAIIAEAVRLLRPGGRYAIHELGLTPDHIDDQVKTEVRQALARSIKVNARPLTPAEWQQLLVEHGLVVDRVETAPMALLQPGRLISDEGLIGALCFARNLVTHRDVRRRVLAMRKTFRTHREHLTAVAIVAHKPVPAPERVQADLRSP
jgi:SAM-dependent methyltransferase